MRPARPNWIVPALAVAALAACAIGWHARPEDFFRGYLPAFLFWMGIPLGAMTFLLMHQLTGGDWGVAIRRPARAAILTLPLMAVFFVPVIVGINRLYPWAGPTIARQALHLGHKTAYLNTNFFVIRAAIYFVIWVGTGLLLLSLQTRQDQDPDPARAARLRAIGAVGLILYFLTATFAAIDWMMSLEPEWYSSIYGFYVTAGQGLSGMAMMIAVLVARDACKTASSPSPFGGRPGGGPNERGSAPQPRFRTERNEEPPSQPPPKGRGEESLTPPVLHDLGNLLFMTIFFYAYIAFSQYLIIWSGNTAEEVPWYIARNAGGWRFVPGILAVTHFALPFALLLSRKIKRRARAMLAIALLVLAAHVLDTAWMVLPAFTGLTAWTWLLAAAAFIAIGGTWWTMFVFAGGTSVSDAATEMSDSAHDSETA